MKFEPSDLYSRLLMSDSDMDSLEIVPLGGPDGSDEPFELPEELAILPIRQTVLFPGMVIPVTVVRQKAIRLVKKIYRNSDINQRILGPASTQAHPVHRDTSSPSRPRWRRSRGSGLACCTAEPGGRRRGTKGRSCHTSSPSRSRARPRPLSSASS